MSLEAAASERDIFCFCHREAVYATLQMVNLSFATRSTGDITNYCEGSTP